MPQLSDIATAQMWSRSKTTTILLTILGLSLALILIALVSSKVASENAANASSTNSTQSVMSAQVHSDTKENSPSGLPAKEPTPSTESNTHTNGDGVKNSVEVRVNGELIPVPNNGSVHRTTQNSAGQTTVDVSSSSVGDGSNSSSSSINLNVSSNSSSFSSNSSSTVTTGGTTENN